MCANRCCCQLTPDRIAFELEEEAERAVARPRAAKARCMMNMWVVRIVERDQVEKWRVRANEAAKTLKAA